MAIGDLYSADNVVVGQAAVLFAPYGTAYPDDTDFTVDDPFDMSPWTGVGGGTPALWQACGATDQGWTFTANTQTQDVTIEEQPTPVQQTVSSKTITVEGSLSEDVAKTLELVNGMTSVDTAASASGYGYTELTLSDDLISYAIALVTVNSFGLTRVYEIPRVVQASNAQTVFRRASAKRMFPATFTSTCKPSDIRIIEITAKQTA